MKAIILAGGSGSRLWPVSRKKNPKQVEPVIGATTLLEATYRRLRGGFPPEDIHVATSAKHADTVLGLLPELPQENRILEPMRRDTAAAIGYAVLRIAATHPDETFVIINCDAHVRDGDEYLRVIAAADRAAREHPDKLLLIGLTPAYPETGYGYIQTGDAVGTVRKGSRSYDIRAVRRFVEKPDLTKAEAYVASGDYLWNPTLVVGTVAHMLALYEKHLPEHAELFRAMAASFGAPDEEATVAQCFPRIPAISIDYGILEKEQGLLVIPADFGWTDVGNWRTVRDILSGGGRENVVKGTHVGIDSEGNLIFSSSGRLIATAGVSDMIIVETGDAVLICPHDRAHDVKRIVAELEGDKSLQHYL